MTINLFDDNAWLSLRPLTFTRPVADLRIGILTIAEKWSKYLNAGYGFVTQEYLSKKFPEKVNADLIINGSICPDEGLLDAISGLKEGEALWNDAVLIAYRAKDLTPDQIDGLKKLKPKIYLKSFVRVFYPEDIFKFNDTELFRDFSLVTKGKTSTQISNTNTIIGDQFFAEEGADAECSTFNTKSGPVYLGKNSSVWEGCNIKGSFALCEGSSVKMGAKIYSQTTIGPFSRVGGEINNAVIWGYSSKGHEGYLGNAVLGQWCNIGADTNNSNLKNNYSEVRLWNYEKENFRKTGMQFCGLIMADHAKCGINTMFNTGTVIGVSANVFGAGFPRHFVPDFAWGGAQGFEVYGLNKMFETAEKVYERRNVPFDDTEREILTRIFDVTKSYRRFNII